MSDAPERIWVNLDSNEDGCCPVEDDLSDTGKFFDRNSSVEYTRTDAIPNAAYVAGLEAALERIMDRHIPDQPAAYGGDELAWVTRQYKELRHIAITALASRPASPDVRVVTVEQLQRWGDHFQSFTRSGKEIRTIIGGQP